MGNELQTNVAMVACLKIFLFSFNVVFWLTGLLFLSLGLWAELELHKYLEMSPDFSGTGFHVIIGLATVIILVSSIGFSCIIKGQPVLLYIYGGMMGSIIMLNIGVILSVTCYRNTFAPGLHSGLTTTLTSSYNSQMANFDFAQSTLHCCGVSNYTDWVRLSPQRVIPTSCCLDPNRCVTANYNDVYQRGCFEVMLEYVQGNLEIIIVIAIGTAFLPTTGLVFACCLANYINKRSKYNMNRD